MNHSTKSGTRSFIHYEPERIDYAVTGEELEKLREGTETLWKDVCLVAIALGVPCFINAIADTMKQEAFSLTLSMFLNYLFGVLGIVFGVIFGVAWYKAYARSKLLLDKIKLKPKMEIVPKTVDVGALPEAHLAKAAEEKPTA